MQAVILAAGNSTRTHPLTVNKPKPLLEVDGKSIVGYVTGQAKPRIAPRHLVPEQPGL